MIVPGIGAGAAMLGSQLAGVLIVATGLLLGAIGLLFGDKLVPHEHPTAGRHGPDWIHLRRV